jgi:hypothetical protein
MQVRDGRAACHNVQLTTRYNDESKRDVFDGQQRMPLLPCLLGAFPASLYGDGRGERTSAPGKAPKMAPASRIEPPRTLRPSLCCTLTSNLPLNSAAFSLALSVRRLALLELCLCLFFLEMLGTIAAGGGAPVLDDTVRADASDVSPWV